VIFEEKPVATVVSTILTNIGCLLFLFCFFFDFRKLKNDCFIHYST